MKKKKINDFKKTNIYIWYLFYVAAGISATF